MSRLKSADFLSPRLSQSAVGHTYNMSILI